MQKRFRIHSQKAPEFHHYDVPRFIREHPAFKVDDLMRGQNYIVLKNGTAHCRITFCTQFRNFKIIRPDNIPNAHWQQIKQHGADVMQDYFDWYSTPPPRTTPAELQKTFLLNFSASLEEGESREPFEEKLYEKWSKVSKIANNIGMLEAYFDEFPAMRSHPMIYALICGQMVPIMDDLPLLTHFRVLFKVKGTNALYDAILPTSYATAFCEQLFKRNVYPLLSDVEGHLTFEIPALSLRNQTTDLILHDLNVDLLMLGALSKEANFLQRTVPSVEHMMQVLPPSIYRFFDMRDRIEYLCAAQFWQTYHFTRISCNGQNQVQHQNIPRRDVLSFAVCNGCTVYCAREMVNFNWTAQYAAIPPVRTGTKRLRSPPPPQCSPQRKEKRGRIAFTDAPQKTVPEEQPKQQQQQQREETVQEELDYETDFI